MTTTLTHRHATGRHAEPRARQPAGAGLRRLQLARRRARLALAASS